MTKNEIVEGIKKIAGQYGVSVKKALGSSQGNIQ
jgi:hypothetical protein